MYELTDGTKMHTGRKFTDGKNNYVCYKIDDGLVMAHTLIHERELTYTDADVRMFTPEAIRHMSPE